jgi:beta-galactosidase GanA
MRTLLRSALSLPALFAMGALSLASHQAYAQNAAPHLEQRGANTQLIVDGQPFFMLSGELHNSSSSSLEYMKPIWPQLASMHLNTVVTPLSWELVEPEEGHFDFALVDGLLAQARENHEKVIFLWLAAWKNGMSGYPPVWVKRDTKRFPRVIINGSEASILSTFAPALREADAHAFAALMAHIKQVDSQDHTVLMMQVENEVGVLGSARDHSAIADKEFNSAVPAELMKYIAAHRETLDPEFKTLWEFNGNKTSGTWSQIFGDTDRSDELFMAWHYATYVHAVAAEGKRSYDIPMFVNTWLGGGTNPPGNYPSGGPQPRVLDVWKAARSLQKGPSLDMYTPDLYSSDFKGWTAKYHRDGNPLFLPETNGGEPGSENIFYAAGEHDALGFSPFAIDSLAFHDKSGSESLSASYATIAEITPILLARQGSGFDAHGNSKTHGFLLDKEHSAIDYEMGDYIVHVSLDEIFGNHSEKGYGLLIQTGPEDFLGAGKGFRVTFTAAKSGTPHVGIGTIDEGHYSDGKWIAGRHLNGDENDQGNQWRFDQRELHIEKATLYRFE